MSATTTTTTTTTLGARVAALPARIRDGAPETRGLQRKVLARLEVLHRQLEHTLSMTASSTGSTGSHGLSLGGGSTTGGHEFSTEGRALQQLESLVARMEELVDADARRSLIHRLTDTRRLRRLQELHEELDKSYRLLRLEHLDPGRQWRGDWATDRAAVDRDMNVALASTAVLFRELPTPASQREALAILQAAIASAPPPASTASASAITDTQTALNRAAFRRLLSFAMVDVPELPPWFASPAELSLDDVPFVGGPAVEVLRGTWGRFNTRVVVKRLRRPSDDPSTATIEGELDRDAALWWRLDHTNVLKMHGGCLFGERPFLLLEDPTNGPLDSYLDTALGQSEHRGPRVYALLLQAARGLQYLHEKHHLIHGDLRLSTIYVGGDGTARLGNLTGFFTRPDDSGEDPRTPPPVIRGAVRWTAPELLLDPEYNGLAADVFSFGMCLLEALGRELPWGMLPDAVIRERVLAGGLPERPVALVDDAAWGLIRAMCDRNPVHRPPMGEVVRQLQGLVVAAATAATAATTTSADDPQSGRSTHLSARSSELFDSLIYDPQGRRLVVEDDLDVDALPTQLSALTTGSSAAEDNADPSRIQVVTLHHKWLGVKINSIGQKIVISKFLRSSSGALGEIEASGCVRLGDVVVAVNDRSVRGMTRHQLGALIQAMPRPVQIMFKREGDLLEEASLFPGLRLEERWRDRGALLPLPNSVELVFGSVRDAFTFSLWFSLQDADDTFYGGVLLGAQDLPAQEPSWPYCHHQLVMVDPQGNLSCGFVDAENPILIAPDLQPNRWYHLAVVYTAQTFAIFLDGALRHQAAGHLHRDWARFRHANIGSGCISQAPVNAKPSADFCGWYGFNGLIYEACAWHSAFSDLEIQQIFRGAVDCVPTPVFSLRRDGFEPVPGTQSPRQVLASRPHHVVAQMYS